jgi:hypothetical protein
LPQRPHERRTLGLQLGKGIQGEPSENRLARRTQHDHDLSPILSLATAVDHTSHRQAVDELYRGVVVNLEALGERPDRGRSALLQSLDLEQGEVLLRFDARGPGGDFAAPQESPDAVAEVGEGGVVDRARRAWMYG